MFFQSLKKFKINCVMLKKPIFLQLSMHASIIPELGMWLCYIEFKERRQGIVVVVSWTLWMNNVSILRSNSIVSQHPVQRINYADIHQTHVHAFQFWHWRFLGSRDFMSLSTSCLYTKFQYIVQTKRYNFSFEQANKL